MNRRILINEDERSRILGLHETRKRQEWGMLFEQADTSKTVAAYGTVEACKTAYNTEYLSGIAMKVTGQNWRVIQKKYLEAKCNGKTPCDTSAASNKNLAMEICEGTFSLTSSTAPTTQTTSSVTGVTFAIDNQATVLNTDKEISDMVKAKKITANTLVFKSPEIPTWTKISALPEDSPIKKSVMAIIATVPPDLPGETKTFKISPDGKQPSKDYTEEQLTTAIKDGSLTQNAYVEVRDASGKATYQPIMQNPDAAKIVNLASGPGQVADQFKTTGIPELDAWLKGPLGSVWDKMEEGKLKEKSLDTYKRQDPQLKAIMDKMGEGKVRDALGTKRNNMLTRGFANLKKAGVEALGGTVTAQR